MENLSKSEILKNLSMRSISVGAWPLVPSMNLAPTPLVFADAKATILAANTNVEFVIVAEPNPAPRKLEIAAHGVFIDEQPPETYGLVLAPYLSANNLELLRSLKVNGCDLEGNGYISVPGIEYYVSRPARKRISLPRRALANPYRGSASLVARTLLLAGEISSSTELLTAARKRGADKLSAGTVSKAVQRLEDDLMLRRDRRSITSINYESLLDNLRVNYQPPKVSRRLDGKIEEGVLKQVFAQSRQSALRVVLSGKASALRYAVGGLSDPISIYCSNIDSFRELAGADAFRETEFFPDVKLVETDDDDVYFDTRMDRDSGTPYASPIQSYLELMYRADKRLREIAANIRLGVLRRDSKLELQ